MGEREKLIIFYFDYQIDICLLSVSFLFAANKKIYLYDIFYFCLSAIILL